MLVSNHISKDFIPPKTNQTIGYGLDLVREFQLTHLPIFEGIQFLGNVSRENLEEFDLSENLSVTKDLLENFSISENHSLLEAFQKFDQNICNILPIFSQDNHYIGLLMMEDAVAGLANMPFILEPGAMMTVSIHQKQFSMSEIAKIVESNNARINSAFVSGHQDDQVLITIKLVSDNLVSVAETFERFGYIVVHKFYNDEKEDLIKDRFDLLMKYLDI